MGQQQETVAGNALRRMILVLSVAALMAVMMVAMAAPAFALPRNGCSKGAHPDYSHGVFNGCLPNK